tara:strand:+ start:1202 stop:1711 length:510 start_codon:yes stop_codon:yes gene_type:complete
MACIVAEGRAWQCKEQTGGISAIYFANYDTLSGQAPVSGIIPSLTGTVELYKYSLPEYTASLTETINASVENGTYFVEQVIEMTLHKLRADERAEIKLLAAGRPQIIVEDNNGNFLLLGYEKGCNMSAGSAQSGTAAGDLSGYQLTFTANEDNTAPFVADLGNANINNP